VKILRSATAGTTEASDLTVTVSPASGKREIVVDSVVATQFYDAIVRTVNEVLDERKIENAYVEIHDRGALDFAIRARLEAALEKAGGAE
jgi:citrate lyase subunit gamma (acyl carrier protein)